VLGRDKKDGGAIVYTSNSNTFPLYLQLSKYVISFKFGGESTL